MQKVAAYLLEREGTGPDGRADEYSRCLATIHAWLRDKGADDPLRAGTVRSLDGSEGTFTWDAAQDGPRRWQQVRLEEIDFGTKYVTTVSLTNGTAGLSVHVTLEAGPSASGVRPLRTNPLCPRVVHDLLALDGDWYHGPTAVLDLQRLAGGELGEQLGDFVLDDRRVLPIVALSEDAQGLALPGLDEQIAHDLTGLANTFSLDPDASWGLTHVLGKRLSCFYGAVRVYWPGLTSDSDPFHHPLWMADRLRTDADPETTADRFRAQLRGLHMRAAAQGVLAPPEVEEIRAATRRTELDRLLGEIRTNSNFKLEAEAYARQNGELEEKIKSLRDENRDLANKVAELHDRLANADLVAHYRQSEVVTIVPVGPDERDDGPRPGEVRFYKNVGHKPKYDMMKQIGDCGHNRWKPAGSADKAKKGIERLEGRNDWKTLQHCQSCQGGGVWKVKW